MTETTVTDGSITARYIETSGERRLIFERENTTVTLAQNLQGYAMVKVRLAPDGEERQRYYGFDMALDHAADILGVAPSDLPVPEPAEDMGM